VQKYEDGLNAAAAILLSCKSWIEWEPAGLLATLVDVSNTPASWFCTWSTQH